MLLKEILQTKYPSMKHLTAIPQISSPSSMASWVQRSRVSIFTTWASVSTI